MFIFFIWIVCMFIGSYMAKKRGRSSIIGFLMGVLFGPFAILIYLIIGETDEHRKKIIIEAMAQDGHQ